VLFTRHSRPQCALRDGAHNVRHDALAPVRAIQDGELTSTQHEQLKIARAAQDSDVPPHEPSACIRLTTVTDETEIQTESKH